LRGVFPNQHKHCRCAALLLLLGQLLEILIERFGPAVEAGSVMVLLEYLDANGGG